MYPVYLVSLRRLYTAALHLVLFLRYSVFKQPLYKFRLLIIEFTKIDKAITCFVENLDTLKILYPLKKLNTNL